MPLEAMDARFELPVAFSLIAHFTFAVTGALAALRRGYDVVGVIFLALITAAGGGLIRDGILISQGPPAFLTDRNVLLTTLGAAVFTLVLRRWIDRLQRPIAVIDALGLGAFAVYGVERCLQGGLGMPGAIIGGTITAVGGGLLRDVLVRDEPLLFKPGQFYALVAIGGCCLFLALIHWRLVGPSEAALFTTIVVFALRLLVIEFNWRTKAFFGEPPKPPA
jgi:uncharacterized membrane protein YeiH